MCSGGDGTLNETVGAVLHLDERIPIGYIPSGTTNDFARSLGIPKDMIEAAKVIVKGRTFNCDIGMVDGQRSFIMLLHSGLLQRFHIILRSN